MRSITKPVHVDASRTTTPTTRTNWTTWGRWTASFIAFPLAGLAGRALAGPLDSPIAALVGGAATGLVIGTGQALAAGRRLPSLPWITATTLGMALGLLGGSAAVGYGTTLTQLAVQGALTGLVLGPLQALALADRATGRQLLAWAAAAPALWALGWTVTTLAGIDVEAQYTVFGATGALTYSALSGLLILTLTRPPTTTSPSASRSRARERTPSSA